MKRLIPCFLIHLTFLTQAALPIHLAKAGFSLPDSLLAVTLKYQTVRDLVILPVTINDTVQVNLILDTGCRNLVLFGKRFRKFFHTQPEKRIQFSGLGAGKPVIGDLSLGNKVSIDRVIGNKIPVVVVPNQNLFGSFPNVDGVIGYDIFIKFEVELNLLHQLITFRPAFTATLPTEYQRIPLRIQNDMPVIDATLFFPGKTGQPCDLIIDTGSSLGLLVKTTDLDKYPDDTGKRVLGRGFNGTISGSQAVAELLMLNPIPIQDVVAGIIYSPYHNHASIGMAIMKNYCVVLNYCKAYAGFRKIS